MGLVTQPVAGPRCHRGEKEYSSICALSNPASRNVFRINSDASRDSSLPVTRPPIVSVRVSRNEIAPPLVMAAPTIRADKSSPPLACENAQRLSSRIKTTHAMACDRILSLPTPLPSQGLSGNPAWIIHAADLSSTSAPTLIGPRVLDIGASRAPSFCLSDLLKQ